jgi:hypothetical protein
MGEWSGHGLVRRGAGEGERGRGGHRAPPAVECVRAREQEGDGAARGPRLWRANWAAAARGRACGAAARAGELGRAGLREQARSEAPTH